MTKNKKNKGFTLIEILVVIGIIAILAAVVLIAINPARQFAQANDSQRSSNVNAILNAIGQYMADNKGALPENTDEDPSQPLVFQEISNTGADICTDLVPKYMPSLPVDPTNDPSEALTETDCESVDGYETGYEVNVDAQGRVTVRANAQIDLDDDPDTEDYIEVTR